MNNDDYTIMQQMILENIKERRSARRWKIFFRVIWLVIIIGIAYIVFVDKEKDVKSGKQIALVKLSGTISDENKTYEIVKKGLNDALQDKNTVAVIIKANSPGGSPVYSAMLYDEILRLRKSYPKKPIEVVAEEVCASGCYYIASAADKIYAQPASIIGSIGVIYTGFGLTGLMQKIGVDSRLIISGKNKAMGYPFVAENPTQTAIQQAMMDSIHKQFIQAVKTGRGSRLVTNDPELFSGRYWIGENAINLGLIDGFATVDSIAREQFNSDNIVDFTPELDPWDKISKKFGVSLVDSAKQAVSNSEFSGTIN